MKWLTVIVGGVIIIGGIWFLLQPGNADSPAPEESQEESVTVQEKGSAMPEGATMEDGTLNVDISAVAEVTSNDAATAAEEEPQGDPIFHALVEYTDGGFSPKNVHISKGDTVRFVNNSSSGMWIGSNNHPTHTLYPEKASTDCLGSSFDTCRALQAGEFWEFTFNQAGEWSYHNHVRSRDGGAIVVAEQ